MSVKKCSLRVVHRCLAQVLAHPKWCQRGTTCISRLWWPVQHSNLAMTAQSMDALPVMNPRAILRVKPAQPSHAPLAVGVDAGKQKLKHPEVAQVAHQCPFS